MNGSRPAACRCGRIADRADASRAEHRPAATNGSSSSSDRAERDEPAGADEYDGYASGDGNDGPQWNLDEYGRSSGASDDDDLPPLQVQEAATSLRDHLSAQLRVTQAGPRDRALVMFLIESLDDDGYLTATLDEVLADLPPELEIDCDELNAALALLHSFDPAGVGARSASECLKLQLLRLDPSPTRTLALEIVSQHLELLAARLHAAAQAPEGERRRAARRAHADPLAGAVPRRRIRQGRGRLRRTRHHREEGRPGMARGAQSGGRAAPADQQPYANILRNSRGDPSAGSLKQQLQEARWLIKNIQQRFDTILRVAQAIVERQRTSLRTVKLPCAPWFCGKLLIRWAYTSRLSAV